MSAGPDSTSALAVVARERARPEDVLRHFLSGRSEETVRAYQRDLRTFAAFLGIGDLRVMTNAFLSRSGAEANRLALEWLQSMQAAKLASATIARRLSALRSLVTVGQLLGVVDWSLRVQSPKVQPYRDVRGPGTAAVHRLYDACGEGLIGLRDRVVVGLMAGHGLRRGEVARLLRSDYDRERGLLRVLGKGNKEAVVTLAAEVVEDLNAWCDAAELEDDGPLLYSLSTKSHRTAMEPHSVWEIVQRIGKVAGVRTWPHGIRHTAITTVAVETRDPFVVKEFGRHESMQTSSRYIDQAMDRAGEGAKRAAAVLIPKRK